MKHFLRFLVAFVLATGVICIQASPEATNTVLKKSIAGKASKHCLWAVRGSSNTVFLLGSMHMMKPSMYPLADEIEAAYKRSGTVIFEMDIKATESPEFAMKVMAQATFPEGDTLKKHLSPATYSLLASNLTHSMVGIEALQQFKPWMVAMTLVVLELQKQGFDAENGVDRHFHKRALADGKKLDTFETPEFQMSLLTGLTAKESEEVLAQALRDMKIWKTQFDDLAKAWTTGDEKAMDELVTDNFRDFPELQKKFVTDRNRAWIGSIEKYLRTDKDVLVVVGAAHLIGKESVVDLLKKKGFKVEQR